MTALPFRLKRLLARDPVPPKSRYGCCPRAALMALAALIFALTPIGIASADEPIKGEVKVVTDGGYARLMFHFDEAVEAKVRVSGAIVVISFTKPVAVAVERLNFGAPNYISAARRDPDGGAIRIALTHKLKVNPISAAERLYVDLMPDSWKGPMPGLPQEVIDELVRRASEAERQLHRQRAEEKKKKPPMVRVKVATQPTFIRYVFTMPGTVNVVPERADGRLVLNFDQQVVWDMADVKATLPPTLKSAEAEVDFDSVAVVFVLNGTPEVRAFREDRSIVVDIGLEGAKPKPMEEGGTKKGAASDGESGAKKAAASGSPAVSPPQTVPVKETPAPAQPPKMASAPPQVDAPVPSPPAAPMAAPAPTLTMEAEQPQPASGAPVAQQQAGGPAAPAAAAPSPSAATPPAAASAAAPAVPAAQPPAAPAPAAPEQTAPAHSPAMQPLAAAQASPAPSAPKEPQSAVGAEVGRPRPNPGAPVVASGQQSGDTLRIEFPFAVLTPAAVFQRADILWLVFDSRAQIDLAALQPDGDNGLREVLFERTKDGAAVVRIKLTRPRMTSLDADGPAWIVKIADAVPTPSQPLTIARSLAGKSRASIAIPFEAPRAIHTLRDPDVGDRLMVITALGPARGFFKPQDFVELRVLPTTHGVVVQPIADDITAELGADKVSISRPSGLSLSATSLGQQHIATSFRAYTFDTQLWGFDRDAPFNARQSELIRLAAAAPPMKRRQARLNLARFYLARDMAPEARAVLKVALTDQRGSEDVTGSVLKAVADVMLDRPDEALKELAKPQVGNQQDAPIWRAIALALQGRWPDAHNIFKTVSAAMSALPIELQRKAMKEALRSAIEVRDFNNATRVVNDFETVGVTPELEPTVNVLIGRLYEGLGRAEDALASYRAAATSNDRRASAQGRLREIALTFASGGMGRKDVISEFETLTTVWRGDETETEGLKLLAHLYTEEGRYRDAFHVMRTALLAHPNSDMTRRIQDEAAVTFESLFLDGKGDALPPIEALGLFYDFRELTPIGRRGDEMIRKLSDRLVSVDLLDQAAELLQHQVDHRLHGAARAQVATRLAVIYLMNRKPDRALATIQGTRIADLSNDLRDQRLLLEARSMSNLGRHDLALELTANINAREAVRLRSDILWAARRWRQAAEQLELLYGERWREFAPLNDTERSDILRAAIGYSLSEESIGLARLREKYGAKFADGPDRRAFDVVTAPIGTSGAEFQDIAKKIASIDTLDAFLNDLRARYPESSAVSPPGAAGEAAATPPAPDKTSPLPPKAPAGMPLKPDMKPTGSIPRLPRIGAHAR